MIPTLPTELPPHDPTRDALRRLAVATLAAVGMALLAYVVPGLERFRVWEPGEAIPMADVFQRWEAVDLPTFAGAGGATGGKERLADQLGAAVAANLGRSEEVVRVDEPPRGETPEPTGAEEAAAVAGAVAPAEEERPTELAMAEPAEPAPTEQGAAVDPLPADEETTSDTPTRFDRGELPPSVRVEPSEYDGIDVYLDDPGHRGMRPFYEALLATARRENGALTRVAHFGDSSIATDLITHTVRRKLQQRFGDAGHGFLLVARGHMPWGHRDVSHRASGDWELREIVRSGLSSGRYGWGGVQYKGSQGAVATFGSDPKAPVGQKVSRFVIHYLKSPRGGQLRYRIDKGPTVTLDTKSAIEEDAFEEIRVKDGHHTLEVSVARGEPRLYGVVLEREGPGVVYDSLGMVGARARRMLNFDDAHFRAQAEARAPSLVVLGFGGNEADDPIHRVEGYEEEFVEVIRRMRAGRKNVGCLVFGPLDQGKRDEKGEIVTMRTLPILIEAQRNAARREGCAFYDTFRAMGGEGSMGRWYRARPRLALGDFRHATPAGYEVIGNMFTKALLEGLAGYLGLKKGE